MQDQKKTRGAVNNNDGMSQLVGIYIKKNKIFITITYSSLQIYQRILQNLSN